MKKSRLTGKDQNGYKKAIIYIETQTHMCIYICIYICVCVCVDR